MLDETPWWLKVERGTFAVACVVGAVLSVPASFAALSMWPEAMLQQGPRSWAGDSSLVAHQIVLAAPLLAGAIAGRRSHQEPGIQGAVAGASAAILAGGTGWLMAFTASSLGHTFERASMGSKEAMPRILAIGLGDLMTATMLGLLGLLLLGITIGAVAGQVAGVEGDEDPSRCFRPDEVVLGLLFPAVAAMMSQQAAFIAMGSLLVTLGPDGPTGELGAGALAAVSIFLVLTSTITAGLLAASLHALAWMEGSPSPNARLAIGVALVVLALAWTPTAPWPDLGMMATASLSICIVLTAGLVLSAARTEAPSPPSTAPALLHSDGLMLAPLLTLSQAAPLTTGLVTALGVISLIPPLEHGRAPDPVELATVSSDLVWMLALSSPLLVAGSLATAAMVHMVQRRMAAPT